MVQSQMRNREGKMDSAELPEQTKDKTLNKVSNITSFSFSLIILTSVSIHTNVYTYIFLINVLYF